jgi:hypothetical protein
MIPVDQEFLHLAIPGQEGDCFRACVASVLELSRDEVPHFAQLTAGSGSAAFWNMAYDWLESRGYEYVYRNRSGRGALDKDAYQIMSGPSPRGNGGYHAVVGQGGSIIHDPHPSRAGLAGDPKKWYWASLIKTNLKGRP